MPTTAKAKFADTTYCTIGDHNWKSKLRISNEAYDPLMHYRYALWFPTKEQAIHGKSPLNSEIFPILTRAINPYDWIIKTGLNFLTRSAPILLKLSNDYKFCICQSLPTENRSYQANDIIPSYKTKQESIKSQMLKTKFTLAGFEKASKDVEEYNEIWNVCIIYYADNPLDIFDVAIDVSSISDSFLAKRSLHPIASKPLPLP